MSRLGVRRSVGSMNLGLIVAFAIILMLADPTFATSMQGTSDTDAQIDALFTSINGLNATGASVIVIQDGKVLRKINYGLANIEFGVANTPETKFRLGSMTKSFTATAILMLHDQEQLNIDDPVSKYLTDFPNVNQITIRHLLTHTSGFSESKEEPLLFEPGKRISYSNYGYNLLGQIIEKVSGNSYETYLQEKIFEPLGMSNSGYDHAAPILKNRASGYTNRTNGTFVNSEYIDMSGPHSAGALYSTVEDLFLWDQALYSGKLLKANTLKQSFTPTKLSSGREAAYGMGWMLNSRGGLQEVGHGGDITGFNSYIARFPDQKFTVVVLSNVGMHPPGPLPTAGSIAQQIIQIYLGDQMSKEEKTIVEEKLSTELLDTYVGVYELIAHEVVTNVAGKTLKIIREGNQLFAEGKLGKALLRAVSETEFQQEGMPLSLTFITDDQGRAMEILISAGGLREFGAKRVK